MGKICPPPYLINFAGIYDLNQFLNLFWVSNEGCKATMVRDIYQLEFQVFKSIHWTVFYIFSVIIFSTHMCLGWQKCIPAPHLDIPKRHHNKATHIGYIMTVFIALIYISFPIYAHNWKMKTG